MHRPLHLSGNMGDDLMFTILLERSFQESQEPAPQLRLTRDQCTSLLGSKRKRCESDEQTVCPICLEPDGTKRRMWRKMPCCGAMMHAACVDRWLKKRAATCPTCRHDFAKDLAEAAPAASAASPSAPRGQIRELLPPTESLPSPLRAMLVELLRHDDRHRQVRQMRNQRYAQSRAQESASAPPQAASQARRR